MFGRDDDAALIGLGGRQELQLDVELLRARRHVDVEGEDIDRVARPGQPLAVARMMRPASFSISPRGLCAPGSHFG